ncbi:peptidoglycan-binding protein [bacterium]|nr:peptidoglycan-binding protein [bacterium]
MIKFTDTLRDEYNHLFSTCVVRPERAHEVATVVEKIQGARARYEAVAPGGAPPWFVIGVIHAMESGLRFDRHLHNGDPLTARTRHVPRNRPREGDPPFTWEQSAADALAMTGMFDWDDWSVAGALYRIEGYNGWGYRRYHPGTLSPYLWSFSNHHTRGRYVADGRFSPTAASRQPGAAILLAHLADTGALPDEWRERRDERSRARQQAAAPSVPRAGSTEY